MRVHLPLCGQLREHVSFSELRLFNECQWRWLLTKLYGIAPEDRSFQMDFGKATHAGMEVLYDRESPGDVTRSSEHALGMYDAALLDYPNMHPSDFEESRRIRDVLPRFYADCLRCSELQGIRSLVSELKLMQPIARTDGLALHFKGFIDITFIKRLKRKTVIYIADFKTCSWGWPAAKFQDIEIISQLLLYKHFFCKMMGADPRNVSTAFILLKKDPRTEDELTVDVRKVSAGPKATERALEYLQRTITEMHSYAYSKNLDACERIWVDRKTGEERRARCPFLNTDDCHHTFDPTELAAEKAASREADALAISSGSKTVEQVHRENSAFAFPRDRVRLTFPSKF